MIDKLIGLLIKRNGVKLGGEDATIIFYSKDGYSETLKTNKWSFCLNKKNALVIIKLGKK